MADGTAHYAEKVGDTQQHTMQDFVHCQEKHIDNNGDTIEK